MNYQTGSDGQSNLAAGCQIWQNKGSILPNLADKLWVAELFIDRIHFDMIRILVHLSLFILNHLISRNKITMYISVFETNTKILTMLFWAV